MMVQKLFCKVWPPYSTLETKFVCTNVIPVCVFVIFCMHCECNFWFRSGVISNISHCRKVWAGEIATDMRQVF